MLHRYGALFFILTMAGPANAGTIAGGSWTPSNCGIAPAEYKLDLSDPDAFNKSVEGVNTYRKASLTYVNCVAEEANVDIQAITKSAKAAQQAARTNDEKIQADVKAADEKFGK